MKKVVRAFSSVTLHSLDSATGVVGVGLHWFREDNRLRPYRKLLPFCSLFLRFFSYFWAMYEIRTDTTKILYWFNFRLFLRQNKLVGNAAWLGLYSPAFSSGLGLGPCLSALRSTVAATEQSMRAFLRSRPSPQGLISLSFTRILSEEKRRRG